MRSASAVFGVVLFSLVATPSFADTIVYNLAPSFSITNNPNGVWSYGWKSTPTGSFSVLSTPKSYLNGGIPFIDWRYSDSQYPSVLKNASTTQTFDNGEGALAPGEVALIAGSDGQPQNFSVVRFTVPSNGAGDYKLEHEFESRLYGGSSKDNDCNIVVKGGTVLTTNLPPNSKLGFTNSYTLNAGDTIDIVVGRARAGQYGSGLKVRTKISTDLICTPRKAKAEAQIFNGFLVGASITDTGCGYTNPPLVIVRGGGGTGAGARAILTDGKVTALQITNAGCCFTSIPQILIGAPPAIPTVEISVSKIRVIQNVVLGWSYVLETSTDGSTWTPTGPAFVADSDPVITEFDSDGTARLFRLRVAQ